MRENEKRLEFLTQLEKKLKEINQGSVDLIYTTSVLRHISPYSFGKVLTQFSRIKPRFIITLEDEASYTYRDFPHNYRKKFADLGWKLLLSDYAIDKKTKL